MSVDGLLTSKVAIITGAGSGVGRAASLIFARHGAQVMAADRDTARIEETIALAASEGLAIIGRTCNVAEADEVDALVAAAVEAYGRLDIIYNNAGITVQMTADPASRSFLHSKQEDTDRLFAVNVGGVINGCKAAIRQFEAQGTGGVIVNTASVAGLTGYGSVIYGSTKGAVTTLTRTLALEVAGQGIRVNSVCPAGMPTNFFPGLNENPAARASMGAAHPLGRPIEPEDCANGALFLACDLASNITGVNLPIDGGLSAGIPLRKS
jgi:NAD(P)-dependent dehydrogenase (short-subunit alcohol dehydrogenase family)